MNALRWLLDFPDIGEAGGAPEPKLPPEVWLRIFDHATHVPGAYACNDGPTLLAYAADQHGIALHYRHREATNTMLSASLVCKAWASLASEFLFRYLIVRSGEHTIKIAKTLDSLASHPLHPSSPSQFTLRLELFLEGVHEWKISHTITLAFILSRCPNIRVFSTAFMSVDALYSTRHFMNAMQVVGLRSTLRRLELKGNTALFWEVLPPGSPAGKSGPRPSFH